MIIYLNFQKKYDDKSVDINVHQNLYCKNNKYYTNSAGQNNSTFSQNKIIPPEFEPEIEYLDKQKSKASFEDKLKMMQMSVINLILKSIHSLIQLIILINRTKFVFKPVSILHTEIQ